MNLSPPSRSPFSNVSMASEDESQGADHHHDEQEWDAHKENFRRCYMVNNMTRKEAAQFMRDAFGFNATPRQWERRIKQWGFQKYSTRDERMSQIAQSGKSVSDVSKPGRRPRAQSSNSLHPREDRNLRRFARREMSRSTSRTRSNSFTDSSRPDLEDESQGDAQPTFDDSNFNLNFSSNPLLPSQNTVGFNATATATGTHHKHPMQLNYQQEKDPSGFHGNAGHGGVFTVGNRKWSDSESTPSTSQWNPPGSQVHMPTYPPALLSHTSIDRSLSNPNGSYLDENASSLGFPMDNGMLLPNAQYDFNVAGDSIGINPSVLSTNPLSEQQLYDPNLQNTQTSTVAQAEFDPIGFQFDVVDVDSASVQLTADGDEYHPMPTLQGAFSTSNAPTVNINFAGPLQNDVGPLVEELVRNMQDIALLGDGNLLEHKLSAEGMCICPSAHDFH